MQLTRPAFANDPKQFGRGRMYQAAVASQDRGFALSDDVKLFAMTFVAGFAFVSILIG
jgi:hypothetical protein